MLSQASFSKCGLYRWSLEREIDSTNRTILFIGLNPSLANSHVDDQTLKRLTGFCKDWGYGSLVVVNLFATISRDPSCLSNINDPIGEKNNFILESSFDSWSKRPFWDLWLGWGVNGQMFNRNIEVLELLKKYLIFRSKKFPLSLGPLCLGFSKGGHPLHPLYVPRKTTLKSFGLKP